MHLSLKAVRGRFSRPCWVVLAGALLLLLPALLNGGAFLYRDTLTYFRGAELAATKLLGDSFHLAAPAIAEPSTTGSSSAGITSVEQGVVIAGRSVYYGALLYLSLIAGSLLFAVAVQALSASYVIFTFTRLFTPLRPPRFLAGLSVLSLATPLGYFTCLAMPDIFAGLAVLIVPSLILGYRVLGWGERLALFLILTFALLSHSSHLPLVLALACAAGALAAFPRSRPPRRPIAPLLLVAGSLSLGFGGEAAFTTISTRVLGTPPIRLPHLSAHLVEMGPGTTYLQRYCPEASFALCADLAHLPVPWIDFLFSPDPASGVFALADPARKRALSDEQVRFAWAVLQDQPGPVIGGFALSFVQQLAMFRLDEVYYDDYMLAMSSTRLPATEYGRVLRSRAATGGGLDRVLSVSTYLIIAASLAVVLAALWRLGRSAARLSADRRQALAAVLLVFVGIIVNAAVCGIIASPFDRFQARLIWLLPIAATALVIAARRSLPTPDRDER